MSYTDSPVPELPETPLPETPLPETPSPSIDVQSVDDCESDTAHESNTAVELRRHRVKHFILQCILVVIHIIVRIFCLSHNQTETAERQSYERSPNTDRRSDY